MQVLNQPSEEGTEQAGMDDLGSVIDREELESQGTMTTMAKENMQNILDIKPIRTADKARNRSKKRPELILRSITEEADEEVDDRYKMLDFLNNLSSQRSQDILTDIDQSYIQHQEKQSQHNYIVRILEGVIDYINCHPDMKVLEITIAKDFREDALSRNFLRRYASLKSLIDSRELEVSIKLISIKQ